MRVTVLAGGTGAAKFLRGLVRIVPAGDVSVVVNTGDDLEWWGLHVSPDLDTICYELGGLLDVARGWGRNHETFHCKDAMAVLGYPAWFNVGDRDLATHLYRSQRLRSGATLSRITAELCARFGIASRVLPMTDQRVRTIVTMDDGEVPFQEFFVHRRHEGNVNAVRFEGAGASMPAPGVLESLEAADVVVIAPSNPVTSVGPILAVPGIADALGKARVVAISPIIGGAAFSGPAAKLMAVRGLPASAAGVALAYRPILSVLLADTTDRGEEPGIRATGTRPVFADIRIRDTADAERLALEALRCLTPGH